MSRLSKGAIRIEAWDCRTALGDGAQTAQQLLRGAIALQPTPVLGKDGGDLVPLATALPYDEAIPPRWANELDEIADCIPAAPWGNARHPVFVTSSNFDVGSLYAYRNTGDEGFLKIGTPAKSLSYLQNRFHWGENALALSHACVTANVGIEMACQRLRSGYADRALIFTFDYISPFVAGGFHSLKILNGQFPAPYQNRNIGSIGLGDGAGFLVLSKEPGPFQIESNFLYNEMFHFTSNDPEGSGFRAAAEWLRQSAEERPIWVKGHGTGTLDAGRLEAEAFNAALPQSPLVSWKGSLGHTLGSCGAVELAIAIESIRAGQIPGTVGSAAPTVTPNVQLDSFPASDFQAVGLFSNAFGGAHAGCLLSYEP